MQESDCVGEEGGLERSKGEYPATAGGRCLDEFTNLRGRGKSSSQARGPRIPGGDNHSENGLFLGEGGRKPGFSARICQAFRSAGTR